MMKTRKSSVVVVLLLMLGLLGFSVEAATADTGGNLVLAQRWCGGRLDSSYWGNGGSGGRDVWAIYTVPAGTSVRVAWRWPVNTQPHYNYVGRVTPDNRDAYAILVGGSALDRFFLRTWGRLALARSAWIEYRC